VNENEHAAVLSTLYGRRVVVHLRTPVQRESGRAIASYLGGLVEWTHDAIIVSGEGDALAIIPSDNIAAVETVNVHERQL
jgi:hypothetical protein